MDKTGRLEAEKGLLQAEIHSLRDSLNLINNGQVKVKNWVESANIE